MHEVQHGRGFTLLRGLPTDRVSTPHDAVLMAYGIGLYLGPLRSQNAKGHLLGHVRVRENVLPIICLRLTRAIITPLHRTWG